MCTCFSFTRSTGNSSGLPDSFVAMVTMNLLNHACLRHVIESCGVICHISSITSFATSAASHPSPHQQHHIVLAHHCNTSISFHFLITAFSLLAFFYFQVLKGHDDHVITCLQFCGNRIVSGSDDNTLKVWSAVTGKVSFGFIYIFIYLKDLI